MRDLVRSPFTADYRPPIEPPAKLEPDQAAYWAVVAQQWHPDDDVRDRILLGMLARAEQSTVAPVLRRRLLAEAELVLADHRPDEQGNCCLCTSRSESGWEVPFACWSVRYARLVRGETAPVPAGSLTPPREGR
ncbi:MAG: hypothetical protein ACRDT4_07015 [Micromonosporaceae bacterium]